jgi:gliding motility-associated-like protein
VKSKIISVSIPVLFLIFGFWACSKSRASYPVNTIKLFVPTAFTPNGDGINDTFIVKASGSLTYYDIKIYESNNILIYENNNIEKGWDGTVKGKPEPAGNYLWIIDYQGVDMDKHTQSGYVQLIR